MHGSLGLSAYEYTQAVDSEKLHTHIDIHQSALKHVNAKSTLGEMCVGMNGHMDHFHSHSDSIFE
jgi:hypothetical protein